MSLSKKIRRSLKRNGIWGTGRVILMNLVNLRAEARRRGTPKSQFDQKYNVDTDTWVSLGDLEIDSPNYAYGQQYAPVNESLFRDAMNQLVIDHSRFTFIDLGSGKGKALLLASAFPFRKIIGVEFSSDLHRVALKNLEACTTPLSCRDIVSIHQDATTFVFPNDPLVILIFNPFIGKTMDEVLDNIESSARAVPREIFVIYMKPIMADAFRRRPVLQEIHTHEHYIIFTTKHNSPGL
jgi:hypothetical protein